MPTLSDQPITSLGQFPYKGESFKCPHCAVTIHPLPELALLGEDSDGVWYLWRSPCASCRKQIYQLLCLIGKKWRFVQPERYLEEADGQRIEQQAMETVVSAAGNLKIWKTRTTPRVIEITDTHLIAEPQAETGPPDHWTLSALLAWVKLPKEPVPAPS